MKMNVFLHEERQFSDRDVNYEWKMWAQISPRLRRPGIKKAVAELMQLKGLWTPVDIEYGVKIHKRNQFSKSQHSASPH
jgi:hypothetical protein